MTRGLVPWTCFLAAVGCGKTAVPPPAPPPPATTAAAAAEPVFQYPARVDADGDALPPGAVARLGAARHRTFAARVPGGGPENPLAAFTSDGKFVVLAGPGGKLSVLDTAGGHLVREAWLGPNYPTDGRTPLLADDASVAAVVDRVREGLLRVRVWDTTGKPVATRFVSTPLSDMAFLLAPDGKRVLAFDGAATARALDVATGEFADLPPGDPLRNLPKQRPPGPPAEVVSPDGTTRLERSERHLLDVAWTAAAADTGRLLWSGVSKDTLLLPVGQLLFSADGKYLAAVRGEHYLGVFAWEVATGRQAYYAATLVQPPPRVGFGPTGNVLVWGGPDQAAKEPLPVYQLMDLDADLPTQWPISRLSMTGWFEAGQRVRGPAHAGMYKALMGRDPPADPPRPAPAVEPTEATRIDSDTAPSGLTAWLGEPAADAVGQFDARRFPEVVSVWNDAGKVIARHVDTRDRLVDAGAEADGRPAFEFAGPSVRWVRVTPDGKRVLVVGRDGLREWVVGAGPPRVRFPDPWAVACLAAARDVALSPDGTRLATALPDGQVLVWDVAPRP